MRDRVGEIEALDIKVRRRLQYEARSRRSRLSAPCDLLAAGASQREPQVDGLWREFSARVRELEAQIPALVALVDLARASRKRVHSYVEVGLPPAGGAIAGLEATAGAALDLVELCAAAHR